MFKNRQVKTIFLILALAFSAQAQSQTVWPQNISIEDVEKKLQQDHITSVESFIASFDKQTRSQFVLMHQSQSLQGASYQQPRVIMFNQTGQIIFTFNSGKSQKNGDKIEMILFDKKQSSFSAHEIDFSQNLPKINKNPESCKSCHGQDLRPNWNGYSFWRGAYGSNDSRLSTPTGLFSSDTTEYLEIQKFLEHAKDNSRYRFLEKLEDVARSVDGSTAVPTRSSSSRMKSTALEQLTQLTLKMNFERFRRVISANPNYSFFKYTLLALMSCPTESFEKSLPDDLKLNLKVNFKTNNMYQSDLLNIGQIKDATYSELLRTLRVNSEFLDTSFNMEYPADLFTPSDAIPYLTSKFSTPLYPRYDFAYALARNDQDLIPYIEATNEQSGRTFLRCDQLALKGRDELRKMNSVYTQPMEFRSGQQVFEQVCLRCHSKADVTDFSFSVEALPMMLKNNPTLLKRFNRRLDVKTPIAVRMPLGVDLSMEERQAVKNYIQALSN